MIALDASVIFGAVERHGTRSARSLRTMRELPGPFLTTEACLAEAMHLAGSRVGWRAQDEIWRILDSISVSTAHSDLELAQYFMRRYRDVPMDYADATLVALCSEDRRIRVATFDSDFLAYRRDDGSPIPLVDDRLLAWD